MPARSSGTKLRRSAWTVAAVVIVLTAVLRGGATAAADEGWVIRAFQATYQVNADGSVDVVEDISVDFGTLQKHGILRDIPVEYDYDARHKRLIRLTNIGVDDGAKAVKYETARNGANLTLRIGDANKLISGPQRYRIRYRVTGALNPQPDWDEFYWNVTGNAWPVRIESASAVLSAPSLKTITCFEGPLGSNRTCRSQPAANTAQFASTSLLSEGSGLTIVAGLTKGSVAVPPPDLVVIKTAREKFTDFAGLKPLPIALAALLGVVGFAGLGRYWWLSGRDRWLGDVQYLTGQSREKRRPLFARDTVVVEYQPPELPKTKRRLRPAEIGTLMDERADTLDVTATIVDLAVRGYLRITELDKKGLFGKIDYRLEKRKEADAELLPYEETLFTALFDEGAQVDMSGLRKEFYTDLARVKKALYQQVVTADNFFPRNPETVRQLHLGGGIGIVVAGVAGVVALGSLVGAAVIGLPIALAGLLVIAFSGAMPRRSGVGREIFRRSLGFREYMTVAETDRQKFAEEAGIFQTYLPYAIVFGCVDRWARAFERMGSQPPTGDWYVASHAFTPLIFSQSLQSFSSSISTAIASTPGGSGSSGFSGGSSGGGMGGGGGGSW